MSRSSPQTAVDTPALGDLSSALQMLAVHKLKAQRTSSSVSDLGNMDLPLLMLRSHQLAVHHQLRNLEFSRPPSLVQRSSCVRRDESRVRPGRAARRYRLYAVASWTKGADHYSLSQDDSSLQGQTTSRLLPLTNNSKSTSLYKQPLSMRRALDGVSDRTSTLQNTHWKGRLHGSYQSRSIVDAKKSTIRPNTEFVAAMTRRSRRDILLASLTGQLSSKTRISSTDSSVKYSKHSSCNKLSSSSSRPSFSPNYTTSTITTTTISNGHIGIHIFIDNSNIIHGFQRYMSNVLSLPTHHIHLKYPALFDFIENSATIVLHSHTHLTVPFPVIKKVLVASKPMVQDCMSETRQYGYETHLLERVTKHTHTQPQSYRHSNGKLFYNDTSQTKKELFVDELLHSKISESLLDYDYGCICLVSGDGNWSEYSTGFSHQIARALRRGWLVIIFSFSDQLSSIYRHFRHEAGFHIQLLDQVSLNMVDIKQSIH